MTGSFFYILEKESVEPHTPLNLPMRRYISYRGCTIRQRFCAVSLPQRVNRCPSATFWGANVA